MTTFFVVFVAWVVLLMGVSLGRKSSNHDRMKETGPMKERKGDKRIVSLTPRLLQLRGLVKRVTNLNDSTVNGVYNYGCWCGPRGEGIIVDNFDYCCKVHDFCEVDVLRNECSVPGGEDFFDKEFEHNRIQCSPLSAYTDTTNENEKKCRRANCLCDLELVRCMRHYREEFDTDNVGWVTVHQRSCALPAGDNSCKPKADVIVLIQDSEGINTATVGYIQTVVRRLLTGLGSQTQDYNFALAIYARSRRISCFGNATYAISYMDREYIHGRRDNQNLFKRALEEMILRQFNRRRDDRQGEDIVKILVMFTDGNAEKGNGRVVDTWELEQTVKVLRDENNIKMVGALIPNTNNTQRISQLKGIVSHPDDAIDVEFSPANLDNIADQLADRVRRLVCRVRYTVEIFTPDTFVRREYRFFITVKGQGELTTTYQLLTVTGDEMQGNQLVIRGEFFDSVDVGTIREVEILPDRIVQGNRRWMLNQVKVTKGEETVTAVFNERIPVFPYIPLTAPATPSEPPTEA